MAVTTRRASRTADITAAVRGAHLLDDWPPFIFSDPYALSLTSAGWRVVAESRLLRWLTVRKLLRQFRTVHGEMLSRARFCEDALERALERGVRQYVILGAGMDSFAFRRRDLAGRVTVFELDHPSSQVVKRARIRRLGEDVPANLVLVPADFEQETAGEVLARTRFDPDAPAFFSCLGTTYYLSRKAVFRTLRAIAETAAEGNEVVLDYCIPIESLPPGKRDNIEQLLAFVARRGEPWVTFFEPDSFLHDMQALGYDVVADLPPEEQERRYFLNRDDDLRGPCWSRFVHLSLTSQASSS